MAWQGLRLWIHHHEVDDEKASSHQYNFSGKKNMNIARIATIAGASILTRAWLLS